LFNFNTKTLNILYFYKKFTTQNMFGLFKKKSKKQKLQEQYKRLLKEAHKLSTTNRKMSDQKIVEAEEIIKQLEKLN